jgi:hypothetical protein
VWFGSRAVRRGSGAARCGAVRCGAVRLGRGSGAARCQLELDEACDEGEDGGVVVSCELLVELGEPPWLAELELEPLPVGSPDRLPVPVGSLAEVDDPYPDVRPDVGFELYEWRAG